MSILSVQTVQTGLVGVLPSIAYINTTDTVAEAVTTGYLNEEVANGADFQLPCLAVVATKATPTSAAVVGIYYVARSGDDWSLTLNSPNQIALPSAQIIVGNSSGIGTAVAMSGDVGINNAGLTTIQAGAVGLAELATGVAPQAVIKFSNVLATTGGSAAEAFFIPGITADDFPVLQMKDNGPNNVTIIGYNIAADSLTVIFSADPGVNTSFNYIITRDAV